MAGSSGPADGRCGGRWGPAVSAPGRQMSSRMVGSLSVESGQPVPVRSPELGPEGRAVAGRLVPLLERKRQMAFLRKKREVQPRKNRFTRSTGDSGFAGRAPTWQCFCSWKDGRLKALVAHRQTLLAEPSRFLHPRTRRRPYRAQAPGLSSAEGTLRGGAAGCCPPRTAGRLSPGRLNGHAAKSLCQSGRPGSI